MRPREFYALAAKLAEGNSTAEHRSAISRAYYSAFHVGLDTLVQLGFRVGRGGAGHGEVARSFANAGEPRSARAGEDLADLHSWRIRADYQLSRIDVEHSPRVDTALAQAQSIIDAFERILTSPDRAQIHATIATWRKSNGYP